jgi:Coenzyme A transferase
MLVNLGIGIPSLVANYLSEGLHVFFQSENGLIGTGAPPEEGMVQPMLTDAAGRPVTALPGASTFDSATSFGLIRGGHVDLTVLGALQVMRRGPARLAIADHARLAIGVWMQRNDLFEKNRLGKGDILDCLPRHGLRHEADEIARMAGLESDANIAVGSVGPLRTREENTPRAEISDFQLKSSRPSKMPPCSPS